MKRIIVIGSVSVIAFGAWKAYCWLDSYISERELKAGRRGFWEGWDKGYDEGWNRAEFEYTIRKKPKF